MNKKPPLKKFVPVNLQNNIEDPEENPEVEKLGRKAGAPIKEQHEAVDVS